MIVTNRYYLGTILFASCLISSLHCLYRSKDVFSCFQLHSNEFLEKSGNVLIENVGDVNECLRKCVQAPIIYRIKCETVMFNVNTGNCVLSKYTRQERTIRESKGLQIDLYENKCNSDPETVRLGIYNQQSRTTTSPMDIRHRMEMSAAVDNNEIRRVHAVKQFPVETKTEPPMIFSKIVQASKNRNAKVFVRPQVDSTSSVGLPPNNTRLDIRAQSDDVPMQLRRQRSDDNPTKCFVKTNNKVLARYEEAKYSATSLETCQNLCTSSSAFYCASFNYNSLQKVCILNGGSVHLNNENLIASREYDYFENVCRPFSLPSAQKENISDGMATKKECYHLYNNSIHNSFDATIVNRITSLEKCEAECSWSHIRRREQCFALNWISTTRGCMLFHKPVEISALVPAVQSIFLINKCAHDERKNSISKTGPVPDYYDSS